MNSALTRCCNHREGLTFSLAQLLAELEALRCTELVVFLVVTLTHQDEVDVRSIMKGLGIPHHFRLLTIFQTFRLSGICKINII